jgi:TonB family protein
MDKTGDRLNFQAMTILNYFIEANAGLILILGCYFAFLRRETNFKFVRLFLLGGIFAALIFPLIHVETGQASSPLAIGHVIPSYWLPEVVIGGEATTVAEPYSFQFWKYTTLVYAVLLVFLAIIVVFQLGQLLKLIRQSQTYRVQKLYVAESPEDKPTFSFFNFIFIGKANALTAEEKQQIIRHESVHARQWHSFDILLINILKIVFWFNPFISTYKKIFIQLHEFEADARAVESSDVNKYCSLLAKVALQSADFTLANHFNNSLTVKRIEMMRTLKSNIKRWKLVALALLLPLVFFFVACQDQVGDDVMAITKNSTHALIIPEHVQARFEQLKKEHPDKNYVVLELNETASEKIQGLESEYGLPKTIEVFGTEGTTHLSSIRGESTGKVVFQHNDDYPKSKRKNQPAFAIVEFNEEASKIADEAAGQDKIYTVVEEQPEFTGGYDAMMAFIKQNMRYPAEARQQGREGTVYVSFIVGDDGAVSDVKVIRGISPAADQEAIRVVESFPNWIPGKQKEKAVKVRFVLPIKFKLTPPAETKD